MSTKKPRPKADVAAGARSGPHSGLYLLGLVILIVVLRLAVVTFVNKSLKNYAVRQ